LKGTRGSTSMEGERNILLWKGGKRISSDDTKKGGGEVKERKKVGGALESARRDRFREKKKDAPNSSVMRRGQPKLEEREEGSRKGFFLVQCKATCFNKWKNKQFAPGREGFFRASLGKFAVKK